MLIGAKIASAVREFGLLDGFLYGLDRWLGARGARLRIFRYHLVAQPVPEAPPDERLMRGVTTRLVESGDPVLAAFPLSAEVLDYRFGQGAECLAVWRKERLLGCFWMKAGAYMEDEVRCRFIPLPEGSVWDFDVYVLPEHRIGRAFSQLWQAAFAEMRRRGARWSISRISGFNSRSRAAHRAMGARDVGAATYFRGDRRQLLIAGLPPFFHWSAGPGDIPTMSVDAGRGAGAP